MTNQDLTWCDYLMDKIYLSLGVKLTRFREQLDVLPGALNLLTTDDNVERSPLLPDKDSQR
jgi:hypothetical protein